MPAVLIETAFISNPKEELKLKDPVFRGQVAEAIATGIRNFISAVGITPKRKAVDQDSAEILKNAKKPS